MTSRTIFYLELTTFLIIPVILFAVVPSFFAIRHYITVIGSLYCLWRLGRASVQLSDLGFQRSGFKATVRELFWPTIFMIAITFCFFYFLSPSLLQIMVGHDPRPIYSLLDRILKYFFISTPLQEIIFRGYLIYRLKEVYSSNTTITIISTLIFTFAHIAFFSPLVLLVATIMGYYYTTIYLKHGNLYGLILSHSIVGTSIILIQNAWFPF